MKLSPIISVLREKCPSFGGRVGGSADYGTIEKTSNLKTPCAFVLPLGESAEYAAFSGTSYRQGVVGQFGVLVFLSTRGNALAEVSYDRSQDLKAEVFRALLGAEVPSGGVITYDGEVILDAGKARLVVQWEFNAPYEIVTEETAQGATLEALGELEGVDGLIDPAPADWEDAVKLSINLKGS